MAVDGSSSCQMNLHQKSLLEGLHQLYSDSLLCDFTVQAGDEYVDVHRCVLAACSPYFKAMLTLDTSENTKRTVVLQNVDSTVLRDLVDFMYSGEISINGSNVQSLLVASDMLQIQGLVQRCENFMSASLCAENCLDVLAFADFQNLIGLKEKAKSFALSSFEDICKSDAFLSLSINHVRMLLSSDDLNVSREELVFEAMMLWIKHDLESRKNDLMLLLFCIRFSLINMSYIISEVARDKLIVNNLFCYQLIERFMRAVVSEGQNPCKEMFSTVLRLGMYSEKMIVFSGGAFSSHGRSFCCFDPVTLRCFYSIKHHPTFDFKFKLDFYKLLVTENNDIYLLGGILYDDYHFESGGGAAKKDIFIYSQQDGKWLERAPMDMPKCAFGACCFVGKIYVFGGYTLYPGHPPIDNVAVYDPSLDMWGNCDTLPIGIAHQATTVFRDSAFLFGGIDADGQYLNTVLQYHFMQDRWTLICTEMPVPRAEASAFANDDHILVLGGSNHTGGISSVNIFNVDRLRWGFGADFPEDRKFTSICQGDGCLYVCGGMRLSSVRTGLRRASRSVEIKDLYKYDLAQNFWVKVTRLVEHGCSFACVHAFVNSKYLKESRDGAAAEEQ